MKKLIFTLLFPFTAYALPIVNYTPIVSARAGTIDNQEGSGKCQIVGIVVTCFVRVVFFGENINAVNISLPFSADKYGVLYGSGQARDHHFNALLFSYDPSLNDLTKLEVDYANPDIPFESRGFVNEISGSFSFLKAKK